MPPKQKIIPTQIRIPVELILWLKHQAIDNYRSMNSEIVARLEDSRRREEAQHDPAAGRNE